MFIHWNASKMVLIIINITLDLMILDCAVEHIVLYLQPMIRYRRTCIGKNKNVLPRLTGTIIILTLLKKHDHILDYISNVVLL